MRSVAMACALVLGVVTACGGKPPPCPVSPTTMLGPPFLWRVQRPAGRIAGPIVWLYGTIHDADLGAVPRAALDALASSPRFASELGDEVPDPEVLRTRARIAKGPGLDQLLPIDDWWELRDALRDQIREEDLKRTRPWYALISLNRRAAGKVVAMDGELAKRARRAKHPVDGLETWDAQLAALDAAVTVPDLRDAIRTHNTLRCGFAGLRATYDAGDTATMEQLLVVPRTAETMLWSRNRAWLPRLETYLASGGAFVAVGLGHLIGDQGLPAQLAKRGYTVVRVTTR